MATSARRPASVTMVMLLTWLVAVLSILGGMFFILASDEVLQEAGISSTTASTYGVTEIVFGAITALVAIGLGRGSRIARLLVTLLMGLRIIAASWAALALSGHQGFWSAVAAGAIALLVLILLWNDRASRFFLSH